MNCIVTAGPTFEPLDQVRRLTNFSTGRLGSQFAQYLAQRGHEVLLLLGEQATWPGPWPGVSLRRFSTTADLSAKLRGEATKQVEAIFHAAAVSDFAFGPVWERSPAGKLKRLRHGKVSSRGHPLLAELVPTTKIIAQLRTWFPAAYLVGWKYEVDGNRADAVAKGRRQLEETGVNACVLNGPAYGKGFGILTGLGFQKHCRAEAQLFRQLAQALTSAGSSATPGVPHNSTAPSRLKPKR